MRRDRLSVSRLDPPLRIWVLERPPDLADRRTWRYKEGLKTKEVLMRTLLKIEIPTEPGNAAVRKGKLGEIIGSILETQQPEAVYFTASNGCRTAYVVVNLERESDIPKYAEPWFLAFNAKIEAQPCMTPKDLAEAGPAIQAAVKQYG